MAKGAGKPFEVLNTPGGTSVATFGRSCYVANAGQNEPWIADPPYESYEGIADGPLYRNSCTKFGSVTDGLSNTVFVGEHHPILSNKTWVGVVPGALTCPKPPFDFNPCEPLGALMVNVHSGPCHVGHVPGEPPVIHPPNSPACAVCQMYAEHPGGCNVLLGDGSVHFISETINQLTWAAMSSMAKGDFVDEDQF